jgi:hypothetical protein
MELRIESLSASFAVAVMLPTSWVAVEEAVRGIDRAGQSLSKNPDGESVPKPTARAFATASMRRQKED